MTDTLEQQEITIFYNKEAEALYLNWLNRLNNEIGKLYDAYNLFSEKVGAGSFDKTTFQALIANNPEAWATSLIDKVVNKFDIPLRPAYLEYYWSEFNKIKGLLHNVEYVFGNSVNQGFNKIPGELFHINNLPEIVNGKLEITDEFLEDKRKFFKVQVEANSEAYRLMNLFMETYNALYEMGKGKGIMATPITFGRGAGIHALTNIETFLQRRNDGTITINDQTLKQLL